MSTISYSILCVLAVVAGAELLTDDCSVKFEDNGHCVCSRNQFKAVTCYTGNHSIAVQPCKCVYYEDDLNMTVVGNCYYSCYAIPHAHIEITSSRDLNNNICGKYGSLNRIGRFCGQCNDSYGLAAYSYQLFSCIPCEDYGYKNWIKYFAMALLPLTVFYIVAVLVSLNVTSSSLSGVVLVIQCITSPIQMDILASNTYVKGGLTLIKIIVSIVCMVNLDFFRMVYSPFCLHPKANILEILSLDYIVAVYPFLLIFMTYSIVTAYDRKYRVLLYIWKPFKLCFNRYRNTYNIRTSLIEVFATFIFLSSVKILGVSTQILAFTLTYGVSGHLTGEFFLLADANIEYFGAEHLPFAVLSLTISFIFVFLPFLLLALYPCRFFQRCLNHCGGRCQLLHVFMDAFQGSYKTHPRDLRSFSAFYLLVRIILMAQLSLFPSFFIFYTSGVVCFVAAAVIAVFQPYKEKNHNIVDTVLFLLMGIYFVSYCITVLLMSGEYQLQFHITNSGSIISLIIMILLFICLFLWKFLRLKVLALMRAARASLYFIWHNNQSHVDSFMESYVRDREGSGGHIYPPLLAQSQTSTY